jgi:hypothetical protein
VFYLREFNFREKLEEKNESRKKYFEFLSSGASLMDEAEKDYKKIRFSLYFLNLFCYYFFDTSLFCYY